MDKKPGLLAVTREKMRTRHLALRSEQTYLQWIRRYVVFHKRRHPRELGATEVEQFLTHLAVDRKVSAATQNQALQALLFLYRHVLEIDLPWLANVTRAVAPKRLPVVLTRAEVSTLLSQLEGTSWLVASLLYGSGLRLMEGLRLRVKDLALERGELMVREGQGREGSHHHGARGAAGAVACAPVETQVVVRGGAAAAASRGLPASCPGAQVPPGRHAVGLAVPVPVRGDLPRPVFGRGGAPPRAREDGRCRARCARPASRSRRAVTRCGTASPRTCWRTVTTSAHSRSCSATSTSRRR